MSRHRQVVRSVCLQLHKMLAGYSSPIDSERSAEALAPPPRRPVRLERNYRAARPRRLPRCDRRQGRVDANGLTRQGLANGLTPLPACNGASACSDACNEAPAKAVIGELLEEAAAAAKHG